MRTLQRLGIGMVAATTCALGCTIEPIGEDLGDPSDPIESGDLPEPVLADLLSFDPELPITPMALRAPTGIADPTQWRFAVISDLHLPNPRTETVDRTIAALIAMRVRFVVVTGDHTNGAQGFDRRRSKVDVWWAAVTEALAPLRDAGIAVLPIAGNHDTYLRWQRDGYEQAFANLDQWAAPFALRRDREAAGFATAPYSYSVDVDGVHLALAHVVDQAVDRDVGEWLSRDLAAAKDARFRLVFGHVPLYSVVAKPARSFVNRFGAILAKGDVDFYVAGHEHVTWDETFSLPGGTPLRQVTVGCASGYYVFPPSKASRGRANCRASGNTPGKNTALTCTMPNGGDFELVRDRQRRFVEHDLHTFTLFTVGAHDIEVAPMTVDDRGEPHAFYLQSS